MKKDQVQIGKSYIAMVSNKLVEVRLDAENPRGGWNATNLATGKTIRIKSAQRLRGPAGKKDKKVAAEATADRGHGRPRPRQTEATADQATAGGPAEAEAMLTTAVDEANPITPVPVAGQDKAKAPKPAKAMSCLDAAAQVLGMAGGPMACKPLIEAMVEKGLWHSDAPTPAATLYSAILREITKKGIASRFRKTERDHFALNAPVS